MPDIVSPEVRSRMMAGIRGTDTKPEMVLRRGLHALGFRFRLHDRRLPGRPDIVFPKHRAVIFANGCFWHGHDCSLFRMPASNVEFWQAKIERNRANDAASRSRLESAGWRQAVIWECALRGRNRWPLDSVIARCAEWLLTDSAMLEIRGKETA